MNNSIAINTDQSVKAHINDCFNDYRAVTRGIESISKELLNQSCGSPIEGHLMDIYVLSVKLRKSLDKMLVE